MIYTFGDGFAAGHIWPEWPQILQAVASEPVINQGYPGAGNDFFTSVILDTAMAVDQPATFVVQWAHYQRFDKLIQDDSWQQIINNDKTYSHAQYRVNDKTWWFSSASEQMREYHSKYHQRDQKILFDAYHMILVHDFLKNQGHNCLYFLTYDSDTSALSTALSSQLVRLPWINGMKGMNSIIDRAHRGPEIQPWPQGHARWVQKYLGNMVDHNKLNRLIDILDQTSWIPYDPDREEKWNLIKKELC